MVKRMALQLYRADYKVEDVYQILMPIQWNVVRRETNYTVLVSKTALDSVGFNAGDRKNRDWFLSTLREWLNSYFLDVIFEGELKKS